MVREQVVGRFSPTDKNCQQARHQRQRRRHSAGCLNVLQKKSVFHWRKLWLPVQVNHFKMNAFQTEWKNGFEKKQNKKETNLSLHVLPMHVKLNKQSSWLPCALFDISDVPFLVKVRNHDRLRESNGWWKVKVPVESRTSPIFNHLFTVHYRDSLNISWKSVPICSSGLLINKETLDVSPRPFGRDKNEEEGIYSLRGYSHLSS